MNMIVAVLNAYWNTESRSDNKTSGYRKSVCRFLVMCVDEA